MDHRGRLATWGSLCAGALVLGWAWIAAGAQLYADPELLHPFILAKAPASREPLWQAALYVHLAAALTSLPACLLLLSDTLRARAPQAHRWIGRVTGAVVLFALVPSGWALAPTATGGALSVAGFVVSGAITAWGMASGIAAARRGAMAEHRRAVLHVVGQMSVAVASRVMLVVAALLELDHETAYVTSLWIPVLGAVWVVERVAAPRGRQPRSALRAGLALALLSLLAFAAAPRALAAPIEDLPSWIQRVFLTPLAAQEAKVSRFSRTPPPPKARQVRVVQAEPSLDAAGDPFYAIAIDARWSSDPDEPWREVMVGCAYPSAGKIYIDQDGVFVASEWLLGRRAPDPSATVCRAP
jgi:uncharacterized membrane protein